MATKLEKAKEIIKANYKDADCGIFRTRNILGDAMETIYEEDSLTIDICRGWEYFEVFGLDAADFAELKLFYDKLTRR